MLWPPEELRIADPRVSAARRHVDACEACRLYFEQDRALLDLYARAARTRAPMAVRQRVFDALATTRRGPRSASTRSDPFGSHLRHALLLVAVAATVALVVVVDATRASHPEPSAMFVEDYLRRAVGQEQIESDDPRAVTRFLERELGIMFEPLRLAGFQIARAEICLLEGRRGAMIAYESPDGPVSHYLVPREGARARGPALSTSSGVPAMPVVTWATPDIDQALVGEMDPAALLDLAAASLR